MPKQTVKSPSRARARDLSTRQIPASRLWVAAAAVATVVVVGTAGYHFLGDGQWHWRDCLYMTLITISTVGYGEMLPGMDEVAGSREWTILLILLGSGTLLYFASMLTAFIVEGDLRGVLRRRRMQNRIDQLSDHIVLCGAGATGENVAAELEATGTPYVVVDHDPMRLAELLEDIGPDVLFLQGDATDDDVLLQAGISRARGVVAALREDRDNVFVTITARALNERLRIVAKSVENSATRKLLRAGADSVVSPAAIGGMRLVSEMIRPQVVQFLDAMVRDPEHRYRIEAVDVGEGAELAGRSLRDANFRRFADLLIIAAETPDGRMIYNPDGDTVIEQGMRLVVLAESKDLRQLHELVNS